MRNLVKKYILSVLFIIMIFGMGSPVIAVEKPIKVFLDGEKLEFEIDPFIENGNTMVELRTLFEALGLEIEWDQNNRTITGLAEGFSIKMQLDSNMAILNNETYTLNKKLYTIKGRTIVPLRFVTEVTGNQVDWDKDLRTVNIWTEDPEEVLAQEINALFKFHMETLNAEHLESHLLTIAPENRNATKVEITPFFEKYDIEYVLEELTIGDYVEFEKENGEVVDGVVINTVTTNTNLNDEPYNNNRVWMQHVIIDDEESGKVVIAYSEVLDYELLESESKN